MTLADAGFSMPAWAQVVLGIAGLCAAVSVIWAKLLRPAARLVTTSEAMVPLLVQLTDVFHDQPESFRTLSAIASEFHSGSGTSLREIINRLELAALENHHASQRLSAALEMARLLAQRDREAVQQLIILLERLTIRAQRIEDEQAGLAGRPPTRPAAPGPEPASTPPAAATADTHADVTARSLWDGIERRITSETDYSGVERRNLGEETP